mgnify:CR=1 FL=1
MDQPGGDSHSIHLPNLQAGAGFIGKLDNGRGGQFVIKLTNTPEHPLIISKKDAITGEPIPDTVFLVSHSDGLFVSLITPFSASFSVNSWIVSSAR